MNIYQLVFKDIARRKKRVVYAALGVIVGTMTVVSILTVAASGQARIEAQLEKYGPNLTVTPAINNLDMQLGDLSLGTLSVGNNYISQDILPQVRQIADSEIRKARGITDPGDIATIAPSLYVTAQVKGTSVTMVGVLPGPERLIRTWWNIDTGNYLSQPNDIVAGATVATLLDLKVGDSLSYGGTDFNIAGILAPTGSNDDYELITQLDTLQNAAGKQGLVSSIDIRALCNACPVDTIAASLNSAIPGIRALAVKQVAESEMGMLDRINRLMLALAGVTLAIGCFGVANTMMTSVHERIKDIGIMRSAGASQRQIMGMFMQEAVIVGFIGGLLGYAAGSLLAYVIGPLIFQGAAVKWTLSLLPISIGVALLVAVIAAVYPAFRATRIRVADSFRSL
jgi:putative ABC transport system permease protein